jgi:hypothetical protein
VTSPTAEELSTLTSRISTFIFLAASRERSELAFGGIPGDAEAMHAGIHAA